MDINRMANNALDRGEVLGLIKAQTILYEYSIEKSEELNKSNSNLILDLIYRLKSATKEMKEKIVEAE